MTGHLLAVLGLAALCGAWVLVQRWVARHDPEAPGVEGSCGCSLRSANSGGSRRPRAPGSSKT